MKSSLAVRPLRPECLLSSATNSLEFGPQCQADHEMCSREEHGNEEEKVGLNNWLIICALSTLPVPSSTMKFYF